MNEDELNMATRKLLKKFGIQAQRHIEQAITKAVKEGGCAEGNTVNASMTLTINELDLTFSVSEDLPCG